MDLRGLAGLGALALAAAASSGAANKPPAEPPQELDPVVVTGKPLTIPKPRIHYRPAFPMQARHRWEEGCVVLQFTVRTDGKTDDFTILESNPVGVFERDVILAVYRWAYDPAPEPITLVEFFEFRNPRLSTSPVYTLTGTTKRLERMTASGPRWVLDLQLEGHKMPRCKQAPR